MLRDVTHQSRTHISRMNRARFITYQKIDLEGATAVKSGGKFRVERKGVAEFIARLPNRTRNQSERVRPTWCRPEHPTIERYCAVAGPADPWKRWSQLCGDRYQYHSYVKRRRKLGFTRGKACSLYRRQNENGEAGSMYGRLEGGCLWGADHRVKPRNSSGVPQKTSQSGCRALLGSDRRTSSRGLFGQNSSPRGCSRYSSGVILGTAKEVFGHSYGVIRALVSMARPALRLLPSAS
ncbi:hypothetical protein B0H13DRAFT_1867660 [Mycena leptocephala]|nr:hypothetical protein B0H13DRAFT_1867660 [Mycena leptocephala]